MFLVLKSLSFGMFTILVSSDFSVIFLILILSAFLILSTCYSLIFTSLEGYAFPALNFSNTVNSMFTLLLLFFFLFSAKIEFDIVFFNIFFIWSFFSRFSLLFFLSAAFFVLYLSREYIIVKKVSFFEYDNILLFSIFGLILINFCQDLLLFYLAVELQSLCFYVLSTLRRHSEFCAEAGLKYWILGAFSSGLLLVSFGCFYSFLGSIHLEYFDKLNFFSNNSFLEFFALLFFTASLLFKLGAFPMHFWLCDVYDGSPLNITAFFSSAPKIVIFCFFLRVWFSVFSHILHSLSFFLLFSAFGSVCFASVAALYQRKIKRLLSYSTISHTGFLLLAIYCSSVDSVKSLLFYLFFYVLTNLIVFGSLFLSTFHNKQKKYLINWTSFLHRNLFVGILLALSFFSLAGIPPLAGFYSKLTVIFCLLSQNMVLIAVLIVIFSSIACFYYIKLLKIMSFTLVFDRTSSFWIGSGTKHIELFLSFAFSFISFFIFAPNFILNYVSLVALSLF